MQILILLSISTVALLYAIFFVQKYFRLKLEDINLAAMANKIQKAAGAYLWRLYKVLGVVFLIISAVMFLVPQLRYAAVGFVAGFFAATLLGYFALLFLSRFNAHIANRSSHGVVDTFQIALGGANALGIYSVAFALLIISLYYSFTSTALVASGFVGLMLGAGLVAVFVRLSGGLYIQTLSEQENFVSASATQDADDKPDIRNPIKIISLAGNSVIDGMGTVLIVFEIVLSVLAASIIMGASLLPGLSETVLLPLFIVALGLIASAVGIKLVRVSSTTNIFKNLLLTVLGVVVISSIALFPLILWVLGGNIPYSLVNIWLSGLLGLVLAVGILALYYINIFKRFNSKEILSIFALLVSAGLFANYLLAGLYGVTIFVVAYIATICAMLALHMFAEISNSAYKFAELTQLGEERKKVVAKISFISHIIRDSIGMYLWVGTVLVSLLLFILFQHEVMAQTTTDFSLGNPLVLAGIFLGGGLAYWFISRTSASAARLKEKFSKQIKDLDADNTVEMRERSEYHNLVIYITRKVLKETTTPIALVFLFPLMLGLIFGAEILGGFLVGAMVPASFAALSLILKEKDTHKKHKNRDFWNMNLKEALETLSAGGALETEVRGYSKETTSATLASMLFMLIIISLLLIIFL